MSNTIKTTLEEAAVDEGKRKREGVRSLQRWARRIAVDRPLLLIVLIGLISIWMTVSYPEAFPHWDNFAAVLLDAAQSGILTVGMMILLVGGVFDLSVGSILAFSGIVAGVLVKDMGMPPLIAFLGGMLTGMLCGAINGLVITRLRINALITTLAMQGILRGVAQLVASAGVANLPEGFKPFGQTVFLALQSPFWVMLVVVLAAWFAMTRTRFFRQFYYVGSNPRAATLSGIKVERVVLAGFILMGTLAGLAGTLLASRLSNAVVLAGIGTELRAITAAILGGASLAGGAGTIPGAFLGVLFMSLIQNMLIIARVPVFWQSIVVGVVLLFAIGIDQIGRRGR
jgi:ribose/xylose/arabinose/galactoside ABC-type transport system permease subunit